MRTQKRLEKISTAISLLALASGFSVLGLLIIAKGPQDAALIAGGILGIFLGATFLIAACLQWKGGDQIQGVLQLQATLPDEVVSQTGQPGNAICSF